MNVHDKHLALKYCRDWAELNIKRGVQIPLSILHIEYLESQLDIEIIDPVSVSALRSRLDGMDFLESEIVEREQIINKKPRMFRVKVYSKIEDILEVVAQDAATCHFQGIRAIVGRLKKCIQSFL